MTIAELLKQLEDEKYCYKYCREQEGKALKAGDLQKAVLYSENANRSLREIKRIDFSIKSTKEADSLLRAIFAEEKRREELGKRWT
ncbi:hypothetical protein [Oceanobacillus kimchii]|uniref:hypothetical protein n=1 Tax=Oceanobacillus kimchii TaxID=746691 RepID=UPI003C78717D